ncbi:glycosyltransferase, partial [bacterium]|nr:glycosyltransferase [bacterium]
MISVSIIIPVREINAYLCESIPIILRETDESVEIIVLPDAPPREVINWPDCRSRIIPTGNIGPGRKRDVGARIARGETLAFLDDDAYPAVGWLDAAMPHFLDPKVCAVGGPGVTPPD